jgi:hypothetical protein
VDNPIVDKLEDNVRVPDLVYVSPGLGFKRSKESGGVELLEVPALDGPSGRGHLVDRHGREQGEVVRGGVGEHVHGGHKVLRHTDVVEDGLVLPCIAILLHVLAVGPLLDSCLQVPHVGVGHRAVVGMHEAPAPVPHVKPPGCVEVDIACEDDVVHLRRCRLNRAVVSLARSDHSL